jgi:hypothetical protein
MKKSQTTLDPKPKNRAKPKTNSAEPYFYIGLVLKGTEKEYVNLLKYINNRNGSQIIYQCKSLTYLRISREDAPKIREVIVYPDELASQEAT